MNKMQSAASALALVTVALMPIQSNAWGIDYQDTYLSLRYVPENRYPGFAKLAPETAGNISYANSWTYGSNFANIDLENFSNQDRANSVSGKGTNSAFEVYSIFRTVLSGNKISGTPMFALGPLRDIGLEIGGDVATVDDRNGSNKKLIVVGPQFSINLPRGFWTISTVMSKEFSNNASINSGTNYGPAPELETAWAFPFAAGPVPLNFTGFANFIGPIGKGATQDSYHHVEILLHPKLMLDVGELLGYAPRKIEAGVGYEYWHNKFAIAASNNGFRVPGTEENSVFVEIGYHY